MAQQARRLLAALLTVGATLLALGTASAHAGAIGATGVNDVRSDGILLPNAAWNGTGDLDLLASTGASLYRSRMRLDCVDPANTGRFDFTRPSPRCWGVSYDDLVKALANRGITLLPVLMSFRRTADGAELPAAPTIRGLDGTPTRGAFAAFAAAAAARYGSDGTFWRTCGCPARPIQAWQIWNEENNGWWWNGQANADDYAAVFREARAGLRAADPQARAVVGGLTWDPNGQPSFVAPEAVVSALAKENANAFDAVAIHPYTDARGRTGEGLADDVLAFTSAMAEHVRRSTGPDAAGAPRQPIWITEMGWSDTDAPATVVADGLRAFAARLDAGVRARDNMGPVLWYMLRDNSVRWSRDDGLGLRFTTPTGADAGPKPAWDAFAAASQRAPLELPPALADAAPYVAPPAPPPPPPAAVPAPAPKPVAVRAVRSTSRSGGDDCKGADAVPRAATLATARQALLCLVNEQRARRSLKAARTTSSLSALGAKHARKGRSATRRTRTAQVWVKALRGTDATPRTIVAAWLRSGAQRERLLATRPKLGLAVAARGTGRKATAVYALGAARAAKKSLARKR